MMMQRERCDLASVLRKGDSVPSTLSLSLQSNIALGFGELQESVDLDISARETHGQSPILF
jgi:hypothetical protein